MHTLQLRTLLGRVAFAALLPLAITGCDDPTPSTSDGGTDTETDDDGTTDPTATTVTDTMPTTVTDTTPDTDTATDTDPTTATDTETGETETTDTDTTDSETTDSETTDTETGDTETGDTETGDTETGDTESTTGEPADCIVVTPDAVLQVEGTQFYLNIADYGVGADTGDEFRMEFWGSAGGTVDLAAGDNANYSSCTECIRFYEDTGPDVAGQQYFDDAQFFQSAGTMVVSAESDPANGVVSVDLTGVILVEANVDGPTAVSTPVADGRCIEIADGTYATPVPAPDGWNCADSSYEDGATCDCGCGIADPDCADALEATCDECNSAGSCAEGLADCDAITDDDNAVCTANGYVQDFEGVMIPVEFTVGAGDADWAPSMDQAQDGVQSLQSGLIVDNQTSDTSLELDYSAAGSIIFWNRISAEDGWDFLEFYIDDVEQDTWTGEIDWTLRTYAVDAGTHTFRWSYVKDGSDPKIPLTDDTVWIDSVSAINGDLPMP